MVVRSVAHLALVQEVKQWQRKGQAQKAAWQKFCSERIGLSDLDPIRHSTASLRAFLRKAAWSERGGQAGDDRHAHVRAQPAAEDARPVVPSPQLRGTGPGEVTKGPAKEREAPAGAGAETSEEPPLPHMLRRRRMAPAKDALSAQPSLEQISADKA